MAQKLPVYNLKAFGEAEKTADFYANKLKPHVQNHAFTNLPHKHDFYLVMLVTRGSGTHEIDFEKYTVKPGSLFLMRPGQMHFWNLSNDIDGWVFFHSRAFFETGFTHSTLPDFPFFQSSQSISHWKIQSRQLPDLKNLLRDIFEEQQQENSFKKQRLHALVNLVYIALSRSYKPTIAKSSQTYLEQVLTFENQVEQHFKTIKSASEYAALLHISEKHLNRITRLCYNKTSTQLIAERIVLEAKRMLMQGHRNVTEIADELGYTDTSYFVRFFKKNAGVTPKAFLNLYQKR